MRDFTPDMYTLLLQTLQQHDYKLLSVAQYMRRKPVDKCVILRHDIDARPQQALRLAYIEKQMKVKATYYFRYDPRPENMKVLQTIISMGHEIGYHYSDYADVKGDFLVARRQFIKHLLFLRCFYPIKTMSMHGSPRSRYDNLSLWYQMEYPLGLTCEPYRDFDFRYIIYLTDTGRCWDGITIWDRVKQRRPHYHTTMDILRAIKDGTFPEQVLLNTHPQRWLEKWFLWYWELFFQSCKNIVKGWIKR